MVTKFETMVNTINHLCDEEKINNNVATYFINGLSNKIRKARFDIYEIHLSFSGYEDSGKTNNIFDNIKCRNITLYITFVVD